MKTKNISQYLIVIFAFLLPLSKASVALFSVIFTIALLIEHRKRLSEIPRELWQNKPLRYLILFILINTVSLIFVDAENLKAGIAYVKRYYYLIALLIFIFTTLKKEYIPTALSAFLTGMLISELLSYSIALGLSDFLPISGNPKDPTPFMNHLDYSIFLALTSLILLNRFINTEAKKVRFAYLIFFLSTTTNLFITGGRSGQLAFVFSLLVLFILNSKNKLKSLLVYIIVVVSILGLAYKFSPLFKKRLSDGASNINRIVNKQNYCNSFGIRVASLKIAKDIILENPIAGVGVQNNITELRRVANTTKGLKCIAWVNTYHNQYADVLTQFGFLGLGLFLYIFYLIFSLKLEDKEYKNIAVLFVSILLVGFIADAFFYRHFIDGLFALIVGLLLAKFKSEQSTKKAVQ